MLVRRDRRALRITLNRPKALNALDAGMVLDLLSALEAGRDDPDVQLVVVDAAGGRAFCAGGDIRTIRDWAAAGERDRLEAFFVTEYLLNRTIARYPKPYVSLIDGICMGGGMGISMHGAVRAVSEAATLAMPEVAIGFFPDVGASYVLPRLRAGFGLYLGLSGRRVDAADACWLGLATHFVPRAEMAQLADALATDGLGALADHARPPPPPSLPALAGAIAHAFGQPDLSAIKDALAGLDADWAREALAAMQAASPAALRWAFDLLRAGARRSLEASLQAELVQGRIALQHPDFVEGVRAMVIDKDRAPRWAPP